MHIVNWLLSAQTDKIPVSVTQDQFAADMYSFFSKEGDYACYFVTVSTVCQSVWES